MTQYLPDYLIREQMAVGALVVFGVLRVLAAALASHRGWHVSWVDKAGIIAAAAYCAPQFAEWLRHAYLLSSEAAELEGKAIGCGIALFCAPIVSHRLGFE
ncbi:MAG: hypothetical protein QOI13_3048 [Paraburkholderia sp.]|jgi:hypothetical protein|nr:hypothetical protein [Paraburkholderia sp.]